MKKFLLLLLMMPLLTLAQGGQTKEQMLAEIKAEAKPVYVRAQSKILELKNCIKLAKEGQLSKREVLSQFNSSVGAVMGKEKSFSGVEKRINTAGDSYVDFLFNKECARIAIKKAADAKFKAKQG